MKTLLAISCITLLLASAAFAGDGPNSGRPRVVRDGRSGPAFTMCGLHRPITTA